jgi:hypothetical protein
VGAAGGLDREVDVLGGRLADLGQTSSVAGEIVLNDLPPTGSTNSPPMKRP